MQQEQNFYDFSCKKWDCISSCWFPTNFLPFLTQKAAQRNGENLNFLSLWIKKGILWWEIANNWHKFVVSQRKFKFMEIFHFSLCLLLYKILHQHLRICCCCWDAFKSHIDICIDHYSSQKVTTAIIISVTFFIHSRNKS